MAPLFGMAGLVIWILGKEDYYFIVCELTYP